LEFNERQTKTRNGSDYSDVRAVPPKMFAIDGTESDPVAFTMNQDDAPFDLAENNISKAARERVGLARKKRLVQVRHYWR